VTLPTLSLGDPVIVEWEDAYSDPHSVSIEAAGEPCIRRSIGYYVKHNKERFVVCMDIDSDLSEVQTIGVIPMPLIRTVTAIKPTV
jgi:hypothetical protein